MHVLCSCVAGTNVYLPLIFFKRPQIQTLKTESKSESDTKAVNMSALQDDDNMIVELEKQPF